MLGDRAVGICDSPSGLCRRVAAALGRDAGRAVVRLLRAQPPRLAARRARRRGRSAGRAARRRRGAGRLRGGQPVRRRVAAHARDDPERVPLLLLLRLRHGRRDPREPDVARRLSCSSSRRASTTATAQASGDALAAWRATRHERERTYMAEARSAAGVDGAHEGGDEQADNGGYEGEAMAVVDAIANNTRATLICNTANRSALPFLDAGAVVEVPAIVGRSGPQPVAVGAGARPRPGARAVDQGGRAGDDRGGADGLAGAGRQGARAAPARAVGDDGAGDLRRVPARGCRSCRCASDDRRRGRHHARSWTSPSAGWTRCPGRGRSATRAELHQLGRRRRDHRGRRRPARPARRARRARSAPTARARTLRDDARARGRDAGARRTTGATAITVVLPVRRRPRDGHLRPRSARRARQDLAALDAARAGRAGCPTARRSRPRAPPSTSRSATRRRARSRARRRRRSAARTRSCVNESEARLLTGAGDAAGAAAALARRGRVGGRHARAARGASA